MSEEVQPNVETTNESGTKNEQEKKKKKTTKTKKEKKPRSDDAYLIVDASKVRSLRSVIENRIVEILKEEPLLSEKEILVKLIARDDRIKDYYVKTQDLSYIRFVIWDLAKKKIILRAKVLGDRKYTYFFLPTQLDMLKDKIIKAPSQQ